MLLSARRSLVRYGSPHVMRWLRWLPGLILVAPWWLGPASPAIDVRLRDLAGPVSFRLLDWETEQLSHRAGRLWAGLSGAVRPAPDDADRLRAYFALPVADRVAARPAAEAAMERLIGEAYRAAGVVQAEPVALPWASRAVFPPLLVALTSPPNVLVIAPRTALRVLSSTVLQTLDTRAEEQLEQSADSTGISSLVAPIGGLATYPSMVLDDPSAEQVLSSVAHEWVHQYLIFYPLGQGYWSSQQTREINETTADLVGNEIGHQVTADLGLLRPTPEAAPRPGRGQTPAPAAFDFRAFMRQTRQQAEGMLASGQIEAAEAYMRQRRDEVNQHGYQIRKINQAYFALYGSYGEGFAASPTNPIPGLLRQLRSRSPTLADFLVHVRAVTSVDELRRVATS
jgi:hypothetical protein